MAANLSEAHSVVEAFLFLLVNPCPTCGHGAMDPEVHQRSDGPHRFVATCSNCGTADEHIFKSDDDPPSIGSASLDPLSSHAPVNPGSDPSLIIDVGQWLILSSLMEARAEGMPDPAERRWYRVRARQCIDEALKFYSSGESVPPASAFFSESSRRTLQENASRFERARLLGLRDALPNADVSTQDSTDQSGRRRRRWWPFG